MREKSLGVIDGAMKNSDEVRIKYAAKQARIANAWKKWIGQIDGLKRILAQMESRIKYTSKLSESTDKFVSLLSIIEPEFFLFFEDIQKATKTELLKTKYK